MPRVRNSILAAILALTAIPACRADEAPMVYRYNRPQTSMDSRNLAVWRILKLALERTQPTYGDYRLEESTLTYSQKRQFEAIRQPGQITIFVSPPGTDAEQPGILPVRIPVLCGLWGYRVLLIRAGEQYRFDRIDSLRDLSAVTIGQSEFWRDTDILRDAGLQVVTGTTYDGLFRMLAGGRFDAFSRGVTEIVPEYEARKGLKPGLAIEKHLLLHYPMPEYFWFSDSEEGHRLAGRVATGLRAMAEDGSLCRSAADNFSSDLQSLHLGGRQVVEIGNPLLMPQDAEAASRVAAIFPKE